MNFKLELKYLSITNYPSFEKHFEKLAQAGWLVEKIYLGSILIKYKKIEPEELDFSIIPYEMETSYTRKTKDDLEEFQSVSNVFGWTYATKTSNLHIYYKSRDSHVIPMLTDQEEEFNTLEEIAKRNLKVHYFVTALMLILGLVNLEAVFDTLYYFRSGSLQMLSLLIPLSLVVNIFQIMNLRRFIKKNQENLELGKDLEFNESNQIGFKIIVIVLVVGLLLAVCHLLSLFLLFRNRIILIALLTPLIGITAALGYRFIIKPLKKSKNFKRMMFVLVVIIAVILNLAIGSQFITTLDTDQPDTTNLKVISIQDFYPQQEESVGLLFGDISFLVPKSYQYTSISDRYQSVYTEYSSALNYKVAETLIDLYIQQSEKSLLEKYGNKIENSFARGYYDNTLTLSGFTMDDYNSLEDRSQWEAVRLGKEMLIDNSILKDDKWGYDEVYYLNAKKEEILIRNGKEVYYLSDMDFEHPEVIKIIKSLIDVN